MLEILGLDDADRETTRKSLDALWVCNNCPPTVRALYWEDLVRHSKPRSDSFLEDLTSFPLS